jgi:plasmid replication initiation protein
MSSPAMPIAAATDARARTARPVPRLAGRHGAARQPGLDGLSVLLAGEELAHVAPIDFRAGSVTMRVEGTAEHGIATIWDADILIWAASQIVEARDAGIRSSRLMAATPYEILRFIGRGTSLRDYQRLKAALDRLQSTSVATSIRQPNARRLHRFSWINEWKERADGQRPAAGHRTDPAGLVLCRA